MNDMNITRVTVRGYSDKDVLNIYVGSDNVKRIEYYLESVRVIYNDGSFLIYPAHRVLSLGGNMVRDDIWDADPKANPEANLVKPGKFDPSAGLSGL